MPKYEIDLELKEDFITVEAETKDAAIQTAIEILVRVDNARRLCSTCER